MSKPDRLTKLAEKAFTDYLEPGEKFKRENWNLMELNHVITLLRREQQRTVRIIRGLQRQMTANRDVAKNVNAVRSYATSADTCDVIVFKLKGMR